MWYIPRSFPSQGTGSGPQTIPSYTYIFHYHYLPASHECQQFCQPPHAPCPAAWSDKHTINHHNTKISSSRCLLVVKGYIYILGYTLHEQMAWPSQSTVPYRKSSIYTISTQQTAPVMQEATASPRHETVTCNGFTAMQIMKGLSAKQVSTQRRKVVQNTQPIVRI